MYNYLFRDKFAFFPRCPSLEPKKVKLFYPSGLWGDRWAPPLVSPKGTQRAQRSERELRSLLNLWGLWIALPKKKMVA
jgi:hypothetical protein